MPTDRETRFQPGDRVRYRWTHRMAGVIVRRYHSGNQWIVRWENGRELPAYEDNLEREGAECLSR